MNKKILFKLLFVMLCIGFQKLSFALVYVDIPNIGTTNLYGLQSVSDASGVSKYESIPVKVLGSSNQLISVEEADRAKLFAAIQALDAIKNSSYYYHDSNYTLGQQAGLSSQQYLLGATAIDSVGIFSPGNASTFIHSALGFIVDVSLRNYTQQLALDTASYALGKQKAFLDVAKAIVSEAEQNGYISYGKLKAAYYFHLASNRMGDIAYSIFNLVINNTDVATLEAARDGAIALIPVVGTIWSNINAGADAGALLADLTWALYRGALGFYSLLTDSNIFTLMEDQHGVFPKNFFFYDPINPVTGQINNPPAPTFTFSSSAIDAKVGVRIDLDGSMSLDSDGDQLSYQWSLIKPAGSLAKIINPTSATPYFIPDVEGSYWVEMIVFDGIDTNSVGGNVSVTLPVIIPPNTPPVAVISPVSGVSVNSVVTVNGSGSYDADIGDSIISYQWTLIKPPGSNSSLSIATGNTTSFTPDMAGAFGIKLTVSDGSLTSSQTATISVVDVYPNVEIDYEDDQNHVYITNLTLGACTIKQIGRFTVPAGEKWKNSKFAASQGDLILLVRRNSQPTLRNGDTCSGGLAQDFYADGEYDWYGGTNIYNYTADLIEGDTLYLAAFSYSGVSNFSINSIIRVTTDLDGDGVPDAVEDPACRNNPAETFDSDADGVCNNQDKFDNDPAASADSDGDGYPDSWNPGKTSADSTTGLVLDHPAFVNNAAEWADTDNDGVGDNADKFSNDPAASLDSDNDGYPDSWNTGKSQVDSTTGLILDQFINDPAASLDSDGDGYPDGWNPGRTSADSTTGLVLDYFPEDANEWSDSDGDGVGDNSDWAPNDYTEWVDTDGDGVGDNADAAPYDPGRTTNTAPDVPIISDQSVLIDEVATINLSITDSDGDDFLIELLGKPEFVILTGQLISISPKSLDAGIYTLVVRVDDGFGGVTSRQFTISVTPPDNPLMQYSVSAVAGTGGSVTPSSRTVDSGTSASFTVTADSGYSTDSSVGGTCPAGSWSGTTYTTGNVTGDCSVSFSFTQAAPTQYSVSAVAGTGGSVTPSSRTVYSGKSASFTVTADSGYSTDSSVGGTCPAGSWRGMTYTTGNVTGDCSVSFSFTRSITGKASTALLVPDKTSLETVENEFYKIMTASGYAVDLVDAQDVNNSTVDLMNYDTVACFTYGNESAVAVLDQSVVDILMNAVSAGTTFVTNGNACGAKVMSLAGYWNAGVANTWNPALPDSNFLTDVTPNEPLFFGVVPYTGDPQSHTVDFWTSEDHESLQFRVDNTLSYTGRYSRSGQPLITPDRYLASGFGTGFSVGSVSDTWYPEWVRGSGRIIELTGLNWTFDQANGTGGYIGIAGRQILQNIAEGIGNGDSSSDNDGSSSGGGSSSSNGGSSSSSGGGQIDLWFVLLLLGLWWQAHQLKRIKML